MREDFPKDIAYHRRKLFLVFSKARKIMDKKLVSLNADNLMINGKKYTVGSLNKLSEELNMRTFSERSNDKVVVFGGFYRNFHQLSNFYKAPMAFRNYKYYTLKIEIQLLTYWLLTILMKLRGLAMTSKGLRWTLVY